MFMGQLKNVIWNNILFYNCSSEGHKICCRKVLELEKVLEDTFRTVPKQFQKKSKELF